MNNLTKYINKVKKYLKKYEDMTELEIIRYVYIDLGRRFSFDLNVSFGNSETKREIYKKSLLDENIEKSMEDGIIICKSSSYILEYILKQFGVNIRTVEEDSRRRLKHVYNVVTPKEGEEYAIDLQDDLRNIQSRSRTMSFGIGINLEQKSIIPFHELEKVDRKIGYIDDENYYTDDYLYTMKLDIGLFEKLEDKVKFVLENIEVNEKSNNNYAERRTHHEDIILQLFSEKELNKINMIDCYEMTEEGKQYKTCITVESSGETQIYLFSQKENRYYKVSMEDFARQVKDGLVCMQNIQGLKQALRRLKETGEER